MKKHGVTVPPLATLDYSHETTGMPLSEDALSSK